MLGHPAAKSRGSDKAYFYKRQFSAAPALIGRTDRDAAGMEILMLPQNILGYFQGKPPSLLAIMTVLSAMIKIRVQVSPAS